MENKYFVPQIEDIRVGYECEIATEHTLGKGWNWENHEVTDVNRLMKGVRVRVPYITKEQIEQDGWKSTDDFEREVMGTIGFDKGFTDDFWGNYRVVLLFNPTMVAIKIYGEYQDRRKIPLFSGSCKDINTLRYITKLLNIN